MIRVFATALFMLASCAAPIERGGIDERVAHWNSDVRRFIHMHGSESELRDWLARQSIEYPTPVQGPGFIAPLESIHEPDHLCPTDIYLVGEIKGARVLWYRVEAMKRSDCEDPIAT